MYKYNAETTVMLSLRGGLLRLMMAGLVFALVNPASFWVQFILSEIISYIALSYKEGLRMIKKALCEMKSYFKCLNKLLIQSWEAHLPSGFNPLMSLCNSSEKDAENITSRSSCDLRFAPAT